jgi:hypothetical protein
MLDLSFATIILMLLSLPIFMTISILYIKLDDSLKGNKKRSIIYIIFLQNIILCNIFRMWFNLPLRLALIFTVTLFIIFTAYMIIVLIKDRKREVIGDEVKNLV